MTLYVVEGGVKKVCDILFRAKAINRDKGYHKTTYKNGDWVYGLVTRLYDERFENLPAEMTDINGVSGIEVDYKTIGQYTGLTDKNGKKIFEGDIVRYNTYDDFDCQSVVKFGEYNQDGSAGEYSASKCIGFYVDVDNFTCPDWCEYGSNCFSNYLKQQNILEVAQYCEIIGNIHDNPELLR